jgi:uroporphyrinogen-III synthase
LCEGGEPYDWLVFTSANGVRICLERLHILGYDALALCNVRIATIGPATAAALAHSGITADLVPHEYIAEGVVAALMQDAQQRGISLAGQRILLARAAEARKVLLTALQQAGALVDEVAAYDTQAVTHNDEQGCKVLALLQSQQIHILTFTSSSTVRNFVAWLKNCERAITDCKRVTIASIGPITSQTARELGLQVHIEAKEFTIEGLLEAIVRHEG